MPVLLSSGSHSNISIIRSFSPPPLSLCPRSLSTFSQSMTNVAPSPLPVTASFPSAKETIASHLHECRGQSVIRPNTSAGAFLSRFLFTLHATSVGVSHTSVDVQLQEMYGVFVKHSQSKSHIVNDVLC